MISLALIAGCLDAKGQTLAHAVPHDEFYWLGEMNKAANVMLVEQGIISSQLGDQIALSVQRSLELGDTPGASRPDVSQYLLLEKQLVELGGADVTRIHSGRSRQDMLATVTRLKLRERSLQWMAALLIVREKLAALASDHLDTIIPAYTNGVQAQPTTLAHYLLAFDSAFARDQQRSEEAYLRLNRSPLGAAALATSSFPISRPRLAELLGFQGVEENSFDANLVASLDVPLESVQIAQSTALTVGSLIEDIELQYHEVEPWLLLREGSLTGPSSIMPQKRNPYGLSFVRRDASEVVGDATTFEIESHNLATGMLDYKHGQAEKTIDHAIAMLDELTEVIEALAVNRARALEEVNEDYSTTTELADELQRLCNVPFRIGHQFASELVTFGRAHHLRASAIPYSDAQRIYQHASATFGIANAQLPLSDAQFRHSLEAENMIDTAQVEGGPQHASVVSMLEAQRQSIEQDRLWLDRQRGALDHAKALLDDAFNRLMKSH